jgi:hypothetical protein
MRNENMYRSFLFLLLSYRYLGGVFESCSYLRFFANIRIYLSGVRLARQGRAGPETHRLLHFSNAVMCIFRSTLRFFFFCLFDTFVVSSFWLVLLVALFFSANWGEGCGPCLWIEGQTGREGGVRSCAVLCAVMKVGMGAIKVVVEGRAEHVDRLLYSANQKLNEAACSCDFGRYLLLASASEY